jgi:hypothetical protein
MRFHVVVLPGGGAGPFDGAARGWLWKRLAGLAATVRFRSVDAWLCDIKCGFEATWCLGVEAKPRGNITPTSSTSPTSALSAAEHCRLAWWMAPGSAQEPRRAPIARRRAFPSPGAPDPLARPEAPQAA